MKLFTIGYERVSLPALITALQTAGVQTLIDIRELPNSRRAGFSKRILAGSLEAEGLNYLHLKPLGTPKAGRDANKAGKMEIFWPIVEANLDRPEARLAMVEAGETATTRGPACLLCLEHDHRRCHRVRVAEMLAAEHGFAVEHLAPG
jgi:uncharacterized protein (DUF488 family)